MSGDADMPGPGAGLADFWGAGMRAFWSAQQRALDEFAKAAARGAEVAKAGADAAAWASASKAFADMWAAATETSAALARTLGVPKETDPTVAATLGRIFEPQHWLGGADEMGEALQRMAEGPRLADLWNDERRMLAISQAWLALRKASLEHNVVMLDAWMRAARAFGAALAERNKAGGAPATWRETVALWTDTANLVLLETQRGQAYLDSQQRQLRASTEYRLALRDAAEHFGELVGVPTRSEIDELHRIVTQMRRELRALQRAAAPADGPGGGA